MMRMFWVAIGQSVVYCISKTGEYKLLFDKPYRIYTLDWQMVNCVVATLTYLHDDRSKHKSETHL